MAHDYADWLAASGGDSGSAYLYGTFDFDNGMQAWSTLSVNKSIGYWSYDPPYVYLGPFRDTGSDRNLYAIRQLTRYESGGWKNLANTTKELSWDLSAGLKGTLADRFDWEVALGRARYTTDEYVRTVDTQKAPTTSSARNWAAPRTAPRSTTSTRNAGTSRSPARSTTTWR